MLASDHKTPVKATFKSVDVEDVDQEEDDVDDNDVHAFDENDLQEEDEENYEEINRIFSKARHNHIDFFMDLLPSGKFDCNKRDAYGNNIIHICAQNNNRKLAALIHQYYPGVQVSAKNNKLMTPLDYSDKYGFDRVSDWLISKGAMSGMAKTPNAKQFR